jgi:hypothetical protein
MTLRHHRNAITGHIAHKHGDLIGARVGKPGAMENIRGSGLPATDLKGDPAVDRATVVVPPTWAIRKDEISRGDMRSNGSKPGIGERIRPSTEAVEIGPGGTRLDDLSPLRHKTSRSDSNSPQSLRTGPEMRIRRRCHQRVSRPIDVPKRKALVGSIPTLSQIASKSSTVCDKRPAWTPKRVGVRTPRGFRKKNRPSGSCFHSRAPSFQSRRSSSDCQPRWPIAPQRIPCPGRFGRNKPVLIQAPGDARFFICVEFHAHTPGEDTSVRTTVASCATVLRFRAFVFAALPALRSRQPHPYNESAEGPAPSRRPDVLRKSSKFTSRVSIRRLVAARSDGNEPPSSSAGQTELSTNSGKLEMDRIRASLGLPGTMSRFRPRDVVHSPK